MLTNRISRGSVLVLLVASLLGFTPAVQGQLNLATVTGTVKDASDAAVPNAAVTAKNLGTGLERTVKSDANGDYSISNLQVGHYSITVTLTGFETTSIPDIELQVGQSLPRISKDRRWSEWERRRTLWRSCKKLLGRILLTPNILCT